MAIVKDITLPQTGGTDEFSYSCDCTTNVTFSYTAIDWATVTIDTTNKKVTVSAKTNTTENERSFTITPKVDNESCNNKEIKVTQIVNKYFTVIAEDNNFQLKLDDCPVQYSLDGGETWETVDSSGNFPTVNSGQKIIIKAEEGEWYNSEFSSQGRFRVEGNIMSLIYGDDFADKTSLEEYSVSFYNLFYGCTGLTSAADLQLPATTLIDDCYNHMFFECPNLVTAPQLPATTLADNCYIEMFSGCTSLTTAPNLLATTLASSCCEGMFAGCTSLTTAPNLLATTLASSCCQGMFGGCTSLTTAPNLPATTLASSCYQGMFSGCTSLTTAPNLPATTLASSCYQDMFNGCTSLATLPQLSATTLASSCCQGMFAGCTSLTTIPSNYLPTTTLAESCYEKMFSGCTNITTVPNLPATSMRARCYNSMFEGCTSLTSIPSDYLPSTSLASFCYGGMFKNCTNITTVPNLPATTLAVYCYSGMFYGCTSITSVATMGSATNPLPTLSSGCCSMMYASCVNLQNPPENYIAQHTSIPDYAFQGMFSNCHSITRAPILNGTQCHWDSYSQIFYNCTSLTYAKVRFYSTGVQYTNRDWFGGGVPSTGTFVSNEPYSTWDANPYRTNPPSTWTYVVESF